MKNNTYILFLLVLISCSNKKQITNSEYNGKINLPGKTFRWLTLWELDKFIKIGSVVGPHLRSILSLI